LSASDVSRIETGRLKPYATQAERLAHALGVSVEQLLAEVAPDSGACDLVGAA
jgi:ribosome-binding protein aMBF1 (putative translation factor)